MHKLVALIFAAGEGTGMNSSVAKYAHKICGQAMISYAIESTVEAGSDNIMIILGQNGDDIKEFLPENAVIADMTGTTGIWNAILKQKHLLEDKNGTLLVLPADYPAMTGETLKSAFNYHI